MKNLTIIGAIAGDIIGSIYEWKNIKSTDFPLFNDKCIFTDDTVLTIAITDCILHNKDFSKTIKEYGLKYIDVGYGSRFKKWLLNDSLEPYNSFGNGSAMRVSPVGFWCDMIEDVMKLAEKTSIVTHNHIEGIKGSQAIATAIFLARNGYSKKEIKLFIEQRFKYNLNFTLDEIRPNYQFEVSSQKSVPQAIVAFLESSDFESALRLAISIGGDSDTLACMTGGIASAFYNEIPNEIVEFIFSKLPIEFIDIVLSFNNKYKIK